MVFSLFIFLIFYSFLDALDKIAVSSSLGKVALYRSRLGIDHMRGSLGESRSCAGTSGVWALAYGAGAAVGGEGRWVQ